MEHPLINNIDDLTPDQLQAKITELVKKLGMAHRSGNANLRHQVQMALETYQAKYQEKMDQVWNQRKTNGPDFGDKIDIS